MPGLLLDEPANLRALLDAETFAEVCASFTELYGIGIHIYDADGKNVVDVRSPNNDYYDYLFTIHATKKLYTNLVNYLRTVTLSDDGTIERVDCSSGLRYLLLPIVYEGRVLGKVIFGPYRPQTLLKPPADLREHAPEIDLQHLAKCLETVPKASESVAHKVLANIRSVLDVIVHTSYRTHLTSQMHIASIGTAFEDLEKTNETLRNANAKLRELDRLKSNFISTVSHELKTPLTSIIGYSEMLTEGLAGSLSADQTKYVNTILEKSESLLTLIGQVLDLSRIESGNVALHKEQIECGDLVQKCVSDVQPIAIKKAVEIATEVDSNVRAIHADSDKLRRVVNNLLSNAIKFSDEGAVVHVRFGVRQASEVGALGFDVFEPERNDYLQIEVADSGVGIPEDEFERVFDSFYQVDNSSTREYGGTGLGLAIVKNFVRAHGGEVEVTRSPGGGATFRVWIPYAEERLGITARG